jgi:uncharacterized protein YoxC
MPNKNKNRFFPIFENNGEPAKQPASSSQSNKPPPKRARQETRSPPRAPTAQLAIEAPPATSDPSASILTTLNSVLDRVNNLHDQFRNENDSITAVFRAEVLATIKATVEAINTKVCAVLDDVLRRIDELESTPAPAPAPTPCKHEETIAALQKQVEALTAEVATLTARRAPTRPAPAPARPAAPPPPLKTQQPAPQPTKARPTKFAPTTADGFTPETLLPQPQPIAERKLIFQLSRPPTVDSATAATIALRTINKAITEHPDVAHPASLPVVGQATTQSIGHSQLYLFNGRCSLKEYVMFGPSTRCGKCQLYGHPTPGCTAPFPACAVCAEPHLTKHHPCDIPLCKKGPACTHPPILCVSCRRPQNGWRERLPGRSAPGLEDLASDQL